MKNTKTAQYIIKLAKQYNVFFDNKSNSHLLAKKFIELSDDDYLLDDIDQLVLALTKENIIKISEGLSLIVQHKKELMSKNSLSGDLVCG